MTKRNLSRRDVLGATGCAAGLTVLPANAAGKSERIGITKIQTFEVVVPMQTDIINSPEFSRDAFQRISKILKIHSQGTHRLGDHRDRGDVPRVEGGGRARRNIDALAGKNLLDLNLGMLDLPDRGSYAGFEMALYDAVGKAFQWRVYRLLGGLAQAESARELLVRAQESNGHPARG